MATPEASARGNIDAALLRAGWIVQDWEQANISAGPGVAIREFRLERGHGRADYLLFVIGKVAGAIEAKPEGITLAGVETQSSMYSGGLPDTLPAWVRPLPFLYESTGVETQFTNLLDPEPRSRRVFTFHRPETLASWVQPSGRGGASLADLSLAAERGLAPPPSLRRRLRDMPELAGKGLWEVQARAVRNLEASLAQDKPRALIQMATGSGKTVTAITSIYRLVRFGGARRVLFLVDRANLGRQALREFQGYATPDDGRRFTELYNVQLLTSNKLDPSAKVVITTIQRLYSMLKGEAELDPELEEGSQWDSMAGLIREPAPVEYNPAIPIESFDFIFTDECHRSIYNLWRQVLEYFDGFIVGLTATPSKQTMGFFHQNLVMDYNHEQAVADGINVDFDLYRIRTQIGESGSKVEAGFWLDRRDRRTRKQRSEYLDEDFVYLPSVLDRDVVAEDQIRTVVRTLRDRLTTEIFPGRNEVPKTLIYAKDDSHAEDVVRILREEFGKGSAFAQKITYRTTGAKPEDLLTSFRNDYNPRVAVTVDMIATGTDIKPLEVVVFMRAVKSRTFFEQMKGRGVRVIDDTTFHSVTPTDESKTRFVLVDCVGLCEQELVDSRPLVTQPSVPLPKLLDAVAFGTTDHDILSTLAGRLARLDRQLGEPDRQSIARTAGGVTLKEITAALVEALDPDRQAEAARQAAGLSSDAEPTEDQIASAAEDLLRAAAAPLRDNPALRTRIKEIRERFEQAIDTVSQDVVLEAAFSEAAKEKAALLVKSFEQFIADNKDEITALQLLYSRPYARRLRFGDVRELADAIKAPPRSWTPEALWRAYETLDQSKVRGAGERRLLTDLVSLVRFALHQDSQLIPYPEQVAERFETWLAQQRTGGRDFTADQLLWLREIRDAIASGLEIRPDDLQMPPFTKRGGLARASQVFGQQLRSLLDQLNRDVAA